MQRTSDAPRAPLHAGALVRGVALLIAAPAFALWIAITGLLSALAAANIAVGLDSVPPIVDAGRSLLAAFAFWATFVAAGSGLVALMVLGVQSIQAARAPRPITRPSFTTVLWGWACAIPLATGVGALAGLLLRPVSEGIGTELALDAGSGSGIHFADAVHGLITGGTWLLAAAVGLVFAVITTVRYLRGRRARRAIAPPAA